MASITYDLTIQNVAALLYGYHKSKETPDGHDPIFHNKKSASYDEFYFKNLISPEFFLLHFGDKCISDYVESSEVPFSWKSLSTETIKELFSVPAHFEYRKNRYSTGLRRKLAEKFASATEHIQNIYTINKDIIENFIITEREVNKLRNFTSEALSCTPFYCSEKYRSLYFSSIMNLLNPLSETMLDDFTKALTMLLIGALLSDQTEKICTWFDDVQFILDETTYEDSFETITAEAVLTKSAAKKYILKTDLTRINYEQSYTSAMFLNTRETGRPSIALKDLYQVPVFDSDDFSSDGEAFPEYFKRLTKDASSDMSDKLLTIVGQPGSGKSSLIKYLLNNTELLSDLHSYGYKEIIIQRFAELPSEIDWSIRSRTTAEQLFSACSIDLDQADSAKNKILILDGFDEIDVPGNEEGRKEMVEFLSKFIRYEKDFQNFFMVVTCREQYIHYEYLDSYALLSPLTEGQILAFIEKYNNCMLQSDADQPHKYVYDRSSLELILKQEEDLRDQEKALREQGYTSSSTGSFISQTLPMHNYIGDILSIPLILYMTTALKIEFSEENRTKSITDVYDRIFSLNGGIFDHYDFAYDEEQISYNQENNALLKDYREELLTISQQIAKQMFLRQPSKGEISDLHYMNIIDHAVNKISSRNPYAAITREDLSQYMRGNNFLRYLEGANSHYFVHRSMYEYFFASWIFDQLTKILKPSGYSTSGDNGAKNKALEKLLGVLSVRQLSSDIKKHLHGKIASHFNTSRGARTNLVKTWWMEWDKIFTQCLSDDFYHPADLNEKVTDIFQKNTFAFLNSLGILQILYQLCGNDENKRINFKPETSKLLSSYIRNALFCKEELKNNLGTASAEQVTDPFSSTSVEKAMITEIDLQYLSLENINLSFQDLSTINIRHCSFKNASLVHSSLRSLTITDSDFTEVNLSGSDLALLTTEHCSFTDCNLRKTSLEFAKVVDSTWNGCQMDDTNLYASIISGSKFIHSSLCGANMEYCKANGTDFSDSTLYNTNFEGADLLDADFSRAGRNNASFEDCLHSETIKGL